MTERMEQLYLEDGTVQRRIIQAFPRNPRVAQIGSGPSRYGGVCQGDQECTDLR